MPSSPPPIAFSSLARGRVSFEIVAQVTQPSPRDPSPWGPTFHRASIMPSSEWGGTLREAIKILELSAW